MQDSDADNAARQTRNHSPTQTPSLPLPLNRILHHRKQTQQPVGRTLQRETITMDEDQLEIHMTFPGLHQTTITQDSDTGFKTKNGDEFVFVYEEEKRPIVVLLGWAGSQDKYLAKYSAIYEERSCITIRCTAPVEYLFWQKDKLPRISRKLIDTIRDKCSDEHPVFFHIFSNGGAIFYQHISHAMKQAGSPLKVHGVIFDSSPAERRLKSLYGAISAIVGGNSWTNIPISCAITFFLSFIWLIEIIAHAIGKPNTVKTDPSVLAEEPSYCPQIFLYSNSDTLIPYQDVEKFAIRRADRGVRTKLIMFTDSPHVKHFTTYRDVYVSAICDFMNDCLAHQCIETNEEDEPSPSKCEHLLLTKRIVLPSEATNQQ